MKIEQSDIISDGYVRLYRQRSDLPFTLENMLIVDTGFSSISRINAAFRSAMKKDDELAARHPLAWNPEFGYVTARPDLCGTGLEISALFHLEGLSLTGDLEQALNALCGLRLRAQGCRGGGMKDAAHLFRISNIFQLGISEQDLASRVTRAFGDLAQQEANARMRLVKEMPRVFNDAISRSIAILQSCRLLSDWELIDIASPLRIAAELDLLENFTREDAESLMRERLDLSDERPPGTYEEQRERDRNDAALADRTNRRFRNVRLNARGKDWLT